MSAQGVQGAGRSLCGTAFAAIFNKRKEIDDYGFYYFVSECSHSFGGFFRPDFTFDEVIMTEMRHNHFYL